VKRKPRQLKKQKQRDVLLRIAKSDLGRDDTLVIRTGINVSADARGRISQHLGCKVLIVPPDASLHILRASEQSNG
jgi:hypothetical protein